MPKKFCTYWVHSALGDDFNEGIVWVRRRYWWNDLRGLRRVVRIESKTSGKHIYCEALWADERYLERWIENFEQREDLLRRAPMLSSEAAAKLLHRRMRLETFRTALWRYRTGEQAEPPLVFMGQWHRRRLGIDLDTDVKQDEQYDRNDLEVRIGPFPWSGGCPDDRGISGGPSATPMLPLFCD